MKTLCKKFAISHSNKFMLKKEEAIFFLKKKKQEEEAMKHTKRQHFMN